MKNGNTELLNSTILYKTVGDHGTMLPEKIRYTLPTQTGTLTPTTCVDYTYDESGNITNITYTGHENSMTYTYDKFNRLIREDDKELRRTMVYTYDGDGNITSKQQMVYQTETPAPGVNAITYTYSNGKMTAYNGLVCSYDAVGNPTVYKGQRATWTKGRKLASYRNTTFTYDGRGRRISKNSTTYTYDSADRLIKTSNGMEFFYDQEGVAGFTYGGEKYCYQKDLQGNIIGIIDNAGQVVVQYKYDAWGVPRSIATASSNYSTIANLNPFRYRGYIYDSETGFYYLQSRYYDPETCRFLNMDSVEYADPQTLNGLNLYAYGLNNPVMFLDPTGHFAIASLLISMALGALASGIISAATQLFTTGEIDPAKVAVSALFGGASAGLSFIGIGGVLGQFAIQGALSVGESITTDLLEGNTIDGDAIGGYVLDFLVGGALGAIGSKNKFKEFKRIGQIENSLTDLVARSFKKKGFKEAFKTLGKKSGKYIDVFLKDELKGTVQSLLDIPIDIGLYWLNKGIEFVF